MRAISFTVTRRFSFTMTPTAAMASGVTTGCAWPGRGETVTELMPFMNFLVHSYTCCSYRHASPYWTFICRWISVGFTHSLFKNRRHNAVLLWCVFASGTAIFTLLLRRRVAFLHRTATCRPLFKPSVSLLSTYKTVELWFEFLSHFYDFHLTVPRTWHTSRETQCVVISKTSRWMTHGEGNKPIIPRIVRNRVIDWHVVFI